MNAWYLCMASWLNSRPRRCVVSMYHSGHFVLRALASFASGFAWAYFNCDVLTLSAHRPAPYSNNGIDSLCTASNQPALTFLDRGASTNPTLASLYEFVRSAALWRTSCRLPIPDLLDRIRLPASSQHRHDHNSRTSVTTLSRPFHSLIPTLLCWWCSAALACHVAEPKRPERKKAVSIWLLTLFLTNPISLTTSR